jgi:hypothetical protein
MQMRTLFKENDLISVSFLILLRLIFVWAIEIDIVSFVG